MLQFSYTTSNQNVHDSVTAAPSPSKVFDSHVLKTYLQHLPKHQEALKTLDQGWKHVHSQDTQPIKDLADRFLPHIDQVCILGIGGSMLGPEFLYHALAHKQKSTTKHLDFHFLDNIDPDNILRIRRQLQLQRTLFLVQSKSGQTPETVSQYAYFLNEVIKQGLVPAEHFVFVTDPEKGFLRTEGMSQSISMLDVPSNIGGRFSVLTPIGLLTAALLGCDIDQMLAGAGDIITNQLENIQDASSYTYACILDYYYKEGYTSNVIMPYSSDLRFFSNWAVQLISESTGKTKDRDNNNLYYGITPIAALGVTDQHSQLQLFVEGPHNKIISFISVNTQPELVIDAQGSITNIPLFSYLKNKTFGDLLTAELKGTKLSIEEQSIPTVSITLDKVNEYSIGQLVQFYQLTIGYLGELTNVDMFNQPGVERSKVLAKENL